VEQLETMDIIEKEVDKVIKNPSETDLERYYFYIENGTNDQMIAPLPENQFKMFYKNLSHALVNSSAMKILNSEISEEIVADYNNSMKKAIVDYILMNLEERERLKIKWVPKNFNLK
jgi:dynein heavy chain